ncbi:MAG TPA: hypothetical protein VES73_02050 [Lamprocystis sp. (in: g-proteobacteria)]|nr:hypothetical protein [Lamprocystis sp. (in: g-proteobacteria)]
MRPSPSNAAPRLGLARLAAAIALLILTLTSCTGFIADMQRLERQAQEITCVSHCQEVKDRCDDDARFAYQQCQAGYQTAQRNFRWCNAADKEHCGYPWWSCSENLYGACTNRWAECQSACRSTRYQTWR